MTNMTRTTASTSSVTAWLVPLVVPALLVAVWYVIYAQEAFQGLFPAPHAVVVTFWDMSLTGELFIHIGASVQRVLLGYLLAIGIAVPLGLLLGWYRKAEQFSEVVIHVGRTIPVMAWIPLTIMWFGMGELSSVFIVALAAFFPVFFNTITGVREVNRNLIDAALNLGVKPNSWLLFREVIVPSAVPMIVTGLNISLGYAWTAIVAAELIFKNQGIGYLIMAGRLSFSMEVVILGMLLICVCGFLFNIGITILERRTSRWQYGLKRG